MEKNTNIIELIEYSISKLESQQTMSVEEREMYKKLIIERENLKKPEYKASWNPVYSIISHLLLRAAEELLNL